MFSKDITTSDAFREMPTSSQALYFHLGMEADDDGFLDNYKGLMRAVNATQDDLGILIAKRFLILFPSKVVVVKHWLINNTVRKDRYSETKHLEEKRALIVKENGSYTDDSNGLPNGNQMATQKRIEEDRRGEDSKSENPDLPNKTKKFKYSSNDLEMANLLFQQISKNTPTFKNRNLESWANDCRLMRESDDRTIEQIKFLIEWSQNDHFWKANILSMSKLREKFDTLVSQAKRSTENPKKRIILV